MLTEAFAGQLFGPPAARCGDSLHHPARRSGIRQVLAAIGRSAYALPELHLRRHRPGGIPAGDRAPGVKHLRVIIGTSAGGMQTWMWVRCIRVMDALTPLRRCALKCPGATGCCGACDRSDPQRSEWNGGNYQKQPAGFHRALLTFQIATTGGGAALARLYPTREKADESWIKGLATDEPRDANDVLYEYKRVARLQSTPSWSQPGCVGP